MYILEGSLTVWLLTKSRGGGQIEHQTRGQSEAGETQLWSLFGGPGVARGSHAARLWEASSPSK